MRKIVQLATMDNREEIYALCDDGTTWVWNHNGEWRAWPPPIPQPEPKEKGRPWPIPQRGKIKPATEQNDGEIKL